MGNNSINLEGLNNEFIQEIVSSFNVLNKNADAKIITDSNEMQGLIGELATANINIFDKNTELLNVILVNNKYIFQLKGGSIYYNHSGIGTYDTTVNYFNGSFLSLLGLKLLQNDYGVIRIEPQDSGLYTFVKLLTHIFSSNDLMIHGHDKFSSKYEVHATDKQIAGSLLTDSVLDAISEYDKLHISISHDKLIIWTPDLNTDATIAMMKIFETFSI